jgi:cell division protein FtsB
MPLFCFKGGKEEFLYMETMRQKPRMPLSPIQKRRLVLAGVCLILISLLWLIFAPDMGVYSVWRQHARLARLQAENVQIEKKNKSLEKDIDQIQNDPHYLEKVARDRGLLKQNEIIFDFSPGKKEKKK